MNSLLIVNGPLLREKVALARRRQNDSHMASARHDREAALTINETVAQLLAEIETIVWDGKPETE
jgi:hypothetical protein